MKLAIMQPYFVPYIGYFQLMNAVDEFVVYDNIQFTKKGWINRNRILANGKDEFLTLQLKKDSDYVNVVDRQLAEVWPAERKKLLNWIKEQYRKTPFFNSAFPLIERVLLFEDFNLFNFILNSLLQTQVFLEIPTPLIVSSTINIDHSLKGQEKVLAICKARRATIYINPIGGVELYKKEEFRENGIDLLFLRTTNVAYKQFEHEFVPFLSILDVLMFNSKEKVREYLTTGYELIG